ncbi:MAG: carboxylesterase family protein [Segetibacter sp.]
MKRHILIFISVLALFAIDKVKAQTKDSIENIVVTTESGKVRGQVVNGISVFKSIPYAAPPVGNQRFAAPVKHQSWNDIRDAVTRGPTAPFPLPKKGDIDDKPMFADGWVKGDDFLANNIWTPDVNGKASGYGIYSWRSLCYWNK